MNKLLQAVVCAALSVSLNAQAIFHVSPNASGNGSSWDEPASLHTALSQASAGDQIWCKQGTYLTSSSGDRNASFVLPSGVTLRGGFAGTEKQVAARNVRDNKTIFSGEIGSTARHDNAYTILTVQSAAAKTTIDGIEFTGGYANGAGPTGDAKRAGGAILIALAKPGDSSQPVFSNCTFTGNFARDGGAIYVDGSAGKATPNFINCVFRNNEADLDGGAVFNDGRRHGLASPSFVGCTFDGNVANYGGAVFNQATKGTCSPKFSDSTFRKNHAYVRGASLYNLDHGGENRMTLVNCRFEDLLEGGESTGTLVRGE